jgi:hypothetical protein
MNKIRDYVGLVVSGWQLALECTDAAGIHSDNGVVAFPGFGAFRATEIIAIFHNEAEIEVVTRYHGKFTFPLNRAIRYMEGSHLIKREEEEDDDA